MGKSRESSSSLGEKLVAASLILGVGGFSLAACNRKANEHATCLSPRQISQGYEGDRNALPFEKDKDFSTWKTGIEVITDVPEDAKGVVVGFSSVTLATTWRDSHPVPPDQAEDIALRIGDRDVEFSVQVVAPLGSMACTRAPDVAFGQPQEFKKLLAKGAVAPQWPSE